MPAGSAYPSGHLVPSPILGLANTPIVETKFLELAMSLLDFSPQIPLGTFSIFLRLNHWIHLISTRSYKAKDNFNFNITNFPFLSSNIPSSATCGVFFFISQLIRYARACTSYECFILRARRLSSKLFKQGYLLERLKSSFRKFYGRYGDLIQPYESSRITNDILTLEQQGLPNRSDFPTISWPWYRAWPSQNFEWFPWSICKGCGMPAGNAYPSEHLVPSPFLELSYAPVVETRFLEISMSLLDFSPWIPFGNFSILRLIGISIESQKRTSVLQTKLAFSSNKIYDSCKCWTCADYCEVFTFLMKKIYMQFRCILYKQIMWICMLTNCAPLKEERHIALHMSVGRSVCRNVGIP